MCPHCGREAPIVYRGVVPQCTACGALRVPLSSPSVNMAGRPSRVGGTVAVVMGWLVLVFGGSIALGLGLLFGAFHLLALALALSLPVALASLFLGVGLVRRGGALSREGMLAEQRTAEQALLAVVAHRGSITAADAARALNVGVAQADAMLTGLAKREPDLLAVDVDDQGVIWYRASDAAGARVRVEPTAEPPRPAEVRVGEVEDDDAASQPEKKHAGV